MRPVRSTAVLLRGAAGAGRSRGARRCGHVTRRSVVASFYPLAYAAEHVGGSPRRRSPTSRRPARSPTTSSSPPTQVDAILDADVVVTGPRLPARGRARGRAPRRADGHACSTPRATAREPIERPARVARPGAHDRRSSTRRAARAHQGRPEAAARRLRGQRGRASIAELRRSTPGTAQGLADCDGASIVTAHEAFGYLAAVRPPPGGGRRLSPDAEPDPKRLAELTDLAEREGVTVVFTEALVSPRIADTLAREAGVRTDVLDPLEGLTDAIARRRDYVTVMDDNLAKLQDALGVWSRPGADRSS